MRNSAAAAALAFVATGCVAADDGPPSADRLQRDWDAAGCEELRWEPGEPGVAECLRLGFDMAEAAVSGEMSLPEGSLPAAFEPLFVAELPDPDAARWAWRTCGGALLSQIEEGVYPPVSADLFSTRAAERLRVFRAAHPDASLETLSYAALDGLLPPDAVGDPATIASMTTAGRQPEDLSALEAFARVTGVPTFDLIGAMPLGAAPTLVTGAVAGVPSIALPTDLNPPEPQTDPWALADAIAAAAPARGPLVLDLRGNQGGELASLFAAAGVFAPRNAPLFTLSASAADLYAYGSRDPLESVGPLLVLIDEDTQAGGLLLAAALADVGVAKIAGAAAEAPDVRIETAQPWFGCLGPERSFQLSFLRYPSGVVTRTNGASLAEGVPVDYPFDASDSAALEAAVRRWLAEEGRG